MPLPEATLQRLSPTTDVATVTVVAGFSATKPTRRRVHDVPSRTAPVSTLGVPGALRGQFVFVFAGTDGYPRARAALDSLAGGGVHRLSRPGVPAVHLVSFIADGDVGLELDESRGVWLVTAQWIETA